MHKRCAQHCANLCGLDQNALAAELKKLGLTSERLHGTVEKKKQRGSKKATPAEASASAAGLSLPDASPAPVADARRRKSSAVEATAEPRVSLVPTPTPEDFKYLKVREGGCIGGGWGSWEGGREGGGRRILSH